MGALVSLEAALADRRLFRGGQPLARGQGATPSGFAALDAVLPWGGFPRGALTEILLPVPGLGELELLSHAWARIGAKERLAFVAPPCIPYAPALLRAKWPPARFAWIEAPPAQAAWAAEQCLRAGCLGAVALWLNGGDDKSLRRLQLAAEEGSVHAFLFRPLRHAANASPAALRLVIESTPGNLDVRVLKVRGAVAPARTLQRQRLDPPAAARAMHDSREAASMQERLDSHEPIAAHGSSIAGATIAAGESHDSRNREVGTAHDSSATGETTVARESRSPRNGDAGTARAGNEAGLDGVRDAAALHDASIARAYRALLALLAGRDLRAAIAARRSSGA